MFTQLYNKCLRLAAHKYSNYFLAVVSFLESSFFPIPHPFLLNAVEADASGAPFADFVDAAALHSTTARTLYARFTQGTGAAAAAGKVFAYIKYIIIK